MNARFRKIPRELHMLMLEATQLIKINDEEEFQYFRNVEYDHGEALLDSEHQKDAIIAETKILAERYAARTVAVDWNPYAGMSFKGLLFSNDLKAGHPALAWCNRTTQELVSEGETVYLAQPSKSRPQGKVLEAELAALQMRLGPLMEQSDFILHDLGLFGELGTYTVDGQQKATPVRVWPLAAGLFIRVTKDRTYEIPDGFIRVPQTVMVMAQEIETMLKRMA